jgi:hypothetical protein
MFAGHHPGAPAISVVVPDCDGADGLDPFLEAFASQTVPAAQFELILAGPSASVWAESCRAHSERRFETQIVEADAADVTSARNAAIGVARAPLLALYSAGSLPHAGLLEHCMSFHASHPSNNQACLLGVAADPAFERLYPRPARKGAQSWQAFRSHAVTCKTELFQHGRFNPRYGLLDGPELGLRLSRRADLTLFYDAISTGARWAPLPKLAACEGHYLAGYYEYRLACAYPGVASCTEPERIVSRDELEKMVSTIRSLNKKPAEPGSSRSKMIAALYARIEEHMRAEGWIASREGRAPEPPRDLVDSIE